MVNHALGLSESNGIPFAFQVMRVFPITLSFPSGSLIVSCFS